MMNEMTTIALGMEVETPHGEVGQVIGSPRDGRGWLVLLDSGKQRRYQEWNLREVD
tara:strand:+ start:264 stop:431 length:168 start_codon:yes stop_codon:yes gene_type:complete